MKKNPFLIPVLLMCLLACSRKPVQDDSVKTAITPDQLRGMLSGLKAYEENGHFIIDGSAMAGLVILSTNTVVPGSKYSYSIRFLYPREDGEKHMLEATVPFDATKTLQGFDRMIITKND